MHHNAGLVAHRISGGDIHRSCKRKTREQQQQQKVLHGSLLMGVPPVELNNAAPELVFR